MTSLEIKLDLKFGEKELAQLELHSFHNILTVIYGELQFLGTILGNPALLQDSLNLCDQFLGAMTDLNRSKNLIMKWNEYKKSIWEDIHRALTSNPAVEEHQHLIEASVSNLNSIFGVVDVRVEELLNRLEEAGVWKTFSTDEVIGRLKQVLLSMAQNSKGAYGVVFDQASKKESDYLIMIDIQGHAPGVITLHPVLLDTLRDLTANSRKYSAPGSVVHSTLVEGDEVISLTVSDSGRGIPENEIALVVGFGIRGSNTTSSETKGGGYGLTKAAHVCQKLGGRMWIESEQGQGTKVTLIIPHGSQKEKA